MATTLSSEASTNSNNWQAYYYALLGVLIFSFTLPMSRLAVTEYSPWLLGMLRGSIGGTTAAVILLLTRSRFPNRQEWRNILIACTGLILGWPLLSNLALQTVPSSQAAVLIGVIPLFTALFASLQSGQTLSRRFWGWCLLGSGLVFAYAMQISQWQFEVGHLYLLLGSAFSGLGYAYGGQVAKTLSGWRTICWCQAVSLPLTIPASLYLASDLQHVPGSTTTFAMLYLALMSSLLGFFPWYKAMAIGNVAKIGQVQLLQPFLAILISALWLGEQVSMLTWASCVLIVFIIAASRKS